MKGRMKSFGKISGGTAIYLICPVNKAYLREWGRPNFSRLIEAIRTWIEIKENIQMKTLEILPNLLPLLSIIFAEMISNIWLNMYFTYNYIEAIIFY